MSDPNDGPFAYRVTKDGKVFISWNGRHVTTLVGHKADAFLAQVDEDDPQLVMARVTGNFRRGNERRASRP